MANYISQPSKYREKKISNHQSSMGQLKNPLQQWMIAYGLHFRFLLTINAQKFKKNITSDIRKTPSNAHVFPLAPTWVIHFKPSYIEGNSIFPTFFPLPPVKHSYFS